MKSLFKYLLLSLVILCLSLPALAKDALTPQEAPGLFFEAVYKMDYVQAWKILTQESQERILKLILSTDKDPKLQTTDLRKLFETADRAVQRGFWTQLRQSMDIETWHKQSFGSPRPADKAGESFVYVSPADIYIFVRQENQGWKFGFVESFEQRRKPKFSPGEKRPTPSPSPGGKP